MLELRDAEDGIRRFHARYADAVFRRDYDTFADCFTTPTDWRVGGSILRTPSEAVEFLKDKMDLFHWVMMTFRTPIVEVTGTGTASSRTYVTEQNAFKDGRPGNSVATYYERFVLANGIWRRAYAFFQLHYMGSADGAGMHFQQPSYGPPPAMPPADEKTVTSIKKG
jgi:hypothetical protein